MPITRLILLTKLGNRLPNRLVLDVDNTTLRRLRPNARGIAAVLHNAKPPRAAFGLTNLMRQLSRPICSVAWGEI
jgi:hypothetical protein